MSSRVRLGVGLVALAVFGALALINFSRTLAAYVSFAEAKTSSSAVQVAGFPDHQRARFDPASGEFLFTITDDESSEMRVSYKGVKPGNFDQAEKVVVVGIYEDNVLHASQILVKCPSKYDDLATPTS